jgi:SNF2 family DNA or RNA helicase
MSVYRKIRKSAASKLTNLESAETFLWDKWIRMPTNEGREIEKFTKRIWDTGKIVVGFDAPALDKFTFKFKKIKIYKSSQKLLGLKSKTNLIFFGFGAYPITNVNIYFKQELKEYFSTVIEDEDRSLSLKIKDQKKKEYTSQLTPHLKKIESEIKTKKTIPVNYNFTVPKVLDYLAEFVPKVYNIDLLNSFNELNSKGKTYQTKVELLDEEASLVDQKFTELLTKPDINSKKINQNFKIVIDKKEYFSELFPWNIIDNKVNLKNIEIEFLKTKSLVQDSIKTNQFKNENVTENIDNDKINKLLQANVDLSDEVKEEILKGLYPYQKEGVAFLAENHFALLCDELGLGKKVQVITAINYLFRKKEIKKVLIITNDFSIGDSTFNKTIGNSYGWEGRLNQFAPNLVRKLIIAESKEIKSEFEQQAQVFIISYGILFKSTEENLINKDTIKTFDCIIYENAEELNKFKKRIQKFFNAINPKFSWMLSNFEKPEFNEKIISEFIPKISLKRTKEEVADQIPDPVRQEYWVELNKDQKNEYDQALSYTQNQITDVLQTGNPYRFQSKVFLSLHQLKQVTNFSLQNIVSIKGQIIASQLKSIAANNKQAVVFSQYDKYGTQKLIELFNQEKISFVKYLPGMPQKDLEDSLTKFEKDKSITVLLAGLQATITKVHLAYAPYIIHLDQWWVPITQWQLEEKVSTGERNKLPITIISYLTRNSVDEKIRQKLREKELLDKNLIDTIGPEIFSKLILENEWIDIFNMPKDKNAKQESAEKYYQNLIQLTPEKIMDKVRLLFVNLGYADIKMKDESSKTRYSITGTFSKNLRQTKFAAQCYLIFKEPDTEAIKYFIESHKKVKSQGKIFIVTLNPEYNGSDIPASENITVINGMALSKHLRMFELI